MSNWCCLLVLVLCSRMLASFGKKEYYQYVINDDADSACVSSTDGGDCYLENELHSAENVDAEVEFDEDLLYGEGIDVIPYDALNDALQDLNAQKNLYKPKRKRNAEPYYSKEKEQRKYHGNFPEDEVLTETNRVTDESCGSESLGEDKTVTCREHECKSISEPGEKNRLTNTDRDSEFYNDGVTMNDLLARKKMEVIRHTFGDEKIKLLQTDKFIHQIIESLGELEEIEYDGDDNNQYTLDESHISSKENYKEDDLDHDVSLDTISENSQKKQPMAENQREATVNSYDYHDSEIPKVMHNDYDYVESDELENKQLNLEHKVAPCDIKHDKEEKNSIVLGGSSQKSILKDQPSTLGKVESIAQKYQDYDDIDTSGDSLDSEELIKDLDYKELDRLEKILIKLDKDDAKGTLEAKTSLPEVIVDSPDVSQSIDSDERFVLSKEQYNIYLKSSVLPDREKEELNAGEPGTFKIETVTSKSKRKVTEDLHDFEVPKFEDIPKVHELPDHHVERLWNEFKDRYKKHYPRGNIDFKKKSHWRANHQKVHQHNEEARQGIHSYTLRDNHLSDLHSLHYIKEMARLTHSRIRRNLVKQPHSHDGVLIPDHLDWREKGFITPDWNQEDCGACYAFSIASAIQGQLFKNKSVLEDLSIQQVVDCSIISGNLGCAGGSLRNTLNYVQFAGGLMKAEDYPYKGKQSICKFKRQSTVVDVSSWSVLPPQDEHALKVTLATIGPVAVSINASPHTFQLYASGIYDDVACTSDFVNHAMLLVGYTRNSWILKNWWTEHWGDKGYMYLRRGPNRCGIANYAVYALI